MFTPDRSGNPEMMEELMKSLDEVTKHIKFRPLALIWKPFRRNQTSTTARPVAIRPTSVTLVEEC